ncbi:MAG: IS982 family transposase, partial [Odoribacter sp.]|nr:IS982 family transposase [Odoribacter sp.]
MLTEDKITEIFVMADEFCKVFNTMLLRRGLSKIRTDRKREYHRDCRLSQAEVIVIMIMFHCSNHKFLKHFYLNEICQLY